MEIISVTGVIYRRLCLILGPLKRDNICYYDFSVEIISITKAVSEDITYYYSLSGDIICF